MTLTKRSNAHRNLSTPPNMSGKIEAPVFAQWLGETLRAIPAPNDAWASIIGSTVWPALSLFLILRFRIFIRRYLIILADRLQHDHLKFGMFELRPNDEVVVLDERSVSDSTEPFEAADVHRIERIFEFVADDEGFFRLAAWLIDSGLNHIDVVDFITLPEYAMERERAWDEVEGLKA